jgi:murein DD-endopeptidase MepM/ murein hydrolase activator NlpD
MTRNASRRLAPALALVIAGALTTTALATPGSGGISPDGEPATESAAATSQEGTFPIRGPHTYGDGLGAGRGHQGQDLMAKCSRPVVAATSGRVRLVDYQGSGAGNFVVIKGKDRRYDYVYMHMLRRASVTEGQRVAAGEKIGLVGSTGRSSACHLHFEMWTAPGWYRGGDVADPTPFLKVWDRKKS